MNAWDWPLTDGLGSIRAVLDEAGNPLHALHYAPYGEPFEATGTPQLPHGFTGEPTDANGLVYLRARYYVPSLGVFPSLDPVEDGNRYAYVAGNVVNAVDPSGMCWGRSDVTYEQGSVCASVWYEYVAALVAAIGPASTWSDEVKRLYQTEIAYWYNLSYQDFVRQWNDPERVSGKSRDSSKTASQECTHGDVNPGFAGGGQQIILLTQPSVAA